MDEGLCAGHLKRYADPAGGNARGCDLQKVLAHAAMSDCYKLSFPNPQAAMATAQNGRLRRSMHAYQCRRCGKWHLSSAPQLPKKRLRLRVPKSLRW